jgi:hypothetical protein
MKLVLSNCPIPSIHILLGWSTDENTDKFGVTPTPVQQMTMLGISRRMGLLIVVPFNHGRAFAVLRFKLQVKRAER